MLVGLTVRDVVLVDRLALAFLPGLTVLTGETGAGKSILLDALGLALGQRADSALVRAGAAQASAAAEFDLAKHHPALALLEDQGIEAAETLILRRQVGADGRSRAFVNDQPVSIAFLREIGRLLVEIEGQFEAHGLLDPTTHRAHLDAFGGHDALLARTKSAFADWRAAEKELASARAALDQARADEDYLRHAAAELELAAPRHGEEVSLAAERQLLMGSEQAIEATNAALLELTGERGADRALVAAERRLARLTERLGEAAKVDLDGIVGALDRAGLELKEAIGSLQHLAARLEADPTRLERIEDRLHLLRDLARKHRVAVDDLPALAEDFARRLALIDGRSGDLAALERARAAAREAYCALAGELSAARARAAKALDSAVNRELVPLKLEKARFATRLAGLTEGQWGEAGWDETAFEVATNPGANPGPIERIASGGELARFMLALKVALAKAQPVPTLVFDEVDAGIGGATAASVGERLRRLAEKVQVLVVTHSPQVAALGQHHWRVEKRLAKGIAVTEVKPLDAGTRREEIARMLSGAKISDEARAAADRLLAGAA